MSGYVVSVYNFVTYLIHKCLVLQADIDECFFSYHTCNENASCINTNGSYLCECNEGYYGNGYTCIG